MKTYTHIDNFPLYNYIQISETNDLRFLLVLSDYYELPEIAKEEIEKLELLWLNLNDEILEYTGVPSDFKEVMRLKKSIALLKVKQMTTDDRSIETLIELKEKELSNMKPVTKQSIEENVINLELILKKDINVQTTSVKKYYSYIKYLKKNI